MRLLHFERTTGFEFLLTFENGETVEVDLQPLLSPYLSEEHLASARIDPDWGCLEFRNGSVDIAPGTLYRFATSHRKAINSHTDSGGRAEEPGLGLSSERASRVSSLSGASSGVRPASA